MKLTRNIKDIFNKEQRITTIYLIIPNKKYDLDLKRNLDYKYIFNNHNSKMKCKMLMDEEFVILEYKSIINEMNLKDMNQHIEISNVNLISISYFLEFNNVLESTFHFNEIYNKNIKFYYL